MKTKTISIITATLTLVLVSVRAQTESGGGGGGGPVGISTVLPIQSQDQVREFALKNVVRGSRYIHAESLDWNYEGTITSTTVTGTSAENILDKLFVSEMVYRLTNPNDTIQGWVYLYDKQDNLLFYGSAQYLAEIIGKEKPSYNIWMQNIPMLSNVQSAEVLALDVDGKTARRYQLDVINGQLLFQPWLAGAPNGILVVRFGDGLLTTYNLAKLISQTPGQTTDSVANWKIDGHHVFVTGQIKIVETWIRPTALVKLDSQQTLTIDVMGLVQEEGKTYFERPGSMVVTNDNGKEGVTTLNPKEPMVFESVNAGTYRLRFNWSKFGQPNTLYTGPESMTEAISANP
ncbi:MAG: hypothetical protein US45_C0008G0016 [Candidatus Nomurabacteria bacterium GW2011_GWA1_37_20]|uniref:Uncharacterized protein n=2 Tax=Parcubacteria group TaxID=1794811 RepID=A0A0G0IA53_9BACT|nr:MAG: hypothetical protein US33_C0008G0029 [Parcubacteria group bacterium GW2011_GWC1_36_9]KKQ27189.1 MAG: hypothetical protein US41_C0023G0019 [Parcubacteria group bacterium GW2011_GWB1_37_13]KKQ33721.1 MAG: hypothetical protein US45_C0008G0016 [Candidatus Nomurabacteria bacterium GW2011_GWA1_37_20]KKQ47875.1 MAG: hypothetical protein US65_C0002G0012 [Candidatus Yanofskybacteria bacterium GW2011_GWC2_37_9]